MYTIFAKFNKTPFRVKLEFILLTANYAISQCLPFRGGGKNL